MLRKYGVWILFFITGLLPVFLIFIYVILSGADFLDRAFFASPAFAMIIVSSHGLSFLALLYLMKKLNITLQDIGWKVKGTMPLLREIILGVGLSLMIYIFKELVLDSISAIMHGNSPAFHSFFNFHFRSEEAALMSVAFLFPFVEESIFRGFPYAIWKNKWSFWKILLITSLIFGLMHSMGGGRDLTSALDTGILGAIYFLIYYWRKNLYCSTAAHSFYNLWIVLT